MKTLVAWRVLTREITRTGLAVFGVFAAIVFAFLQLGFYDAVPTGGTSIYEAMNFDIALVSTAHVYQIRPKSFPRRRLLQAMALPEVEAAMPFYQKYARWLNVSGRVYRDSFVMGIDPESALFRVPSIDSQRRKLRLPDTALIDDSSKPAYGGEVGAPIEISGRTMEIVGKYTLGRGFVSSCVVIVSDQNFARLFPGQSLHQINAGFIRLKPGASAADAARKLRQMLPEDTRVFVRHDFMQHEIDYWLTSTSTGLVFGFGVGIAVVVGCAILFQTLATLIRRNLPGYATLKAIGYTDRDLTRIVTYQAQIITILAYILSVPVAFGLYDLASAATALPIRMTAARIVVVLLMTVVICMASTLISLRTLKKADPVDLF